MKKGILQKITYVIMAMTLLPILLAGCGQAENVRNRVSVFYPDTDYTSISQVETTVSEGSAEAQSDELIKTLAMIPVNNKLRPTLGDRAVVKSSEMDAGILHLDFTASYNGMNKTEEVLTRAAIVETLSQIEGVNYVEFSVAGRPLKNASGDEIGLMNKDVFINDMGDEINNYDRRAVTLYFADSSGEFLVKTTNAVVYTSNMSVEKLVVGKLIEGPQNDEGLFPTISKETGLLSVSTKNGICYVNFDAAVREQPYTVSERAAIYSIVNSLTELSNVDRVQILVDGVSDGVLFKDMSLNTVYERNLDIIK